MTARRWIFAVVHLQKSRNFASTTEYVELERFLSSDGNPVPLVSSRQKKLNSKFCDTNLIVISVLL